MSKTQPTSYFCDDKRHLVCYPYSIDGLHEMAKDLNIARSWFHAGKKKAHYDIPLRRIKEIQEKCFVVSDKDILSIIKGTFLVHDGNFIVEKEMVIDGKFNQGIPDMVDGDFICSELDLKTLEGGPKIVIGAYVCRRNLLYTLKGAPRYAEAMMCSNNNLSSLEYCTKVFSLNASNNLYGLNVEEESLKSGCISSTDPKIYWKEVLKWMVDNNIELDQVKGWPKDFTEKKLFKSSQVVLKFKM